MNDEMPPLGRLLMVAEEIDRQALVAARPGQMDELEMQATLLRKVAQELAAGGIRTEWGVGDPDDCADDDSVREVDSPKGLTSTDRDYGRRLLTRRVYCTRWTVAEDGAS